MPPGAEQAVPTDTCPIVVRSSGAKKVGVDLSVMAIAPVSHEVSEPLILRQDEPSCLSRDRLRSYAAAKAELGLSGRHEQGLPENNRAEYYHQPTRRRERKMQRFKSPGSTQRFLSINAAVQNTFDAERHLISGEQWVSFAAMHLGDGERQLQREARRSVQSLAVIWKFR